MFFPVANQIG